MVSCLESLPAKSPTHLRRAPPAARVVVAEIDWRGARAEARAIRRIAEVAGRVEFRIERRAIGGQLLQQIADACQSRRLDLIRADDRKGLRGLRDALEDARTGDD